MSRNPEVALTLRARDEASRVVGRAMQETERSTQRAERAVIGLSRESQRMASAREQLGVRAERAIQREIRLTEAAYQRLASSGTLSAKEQSRAYTAMRNQVRELRREMQGVSQLQRGMMAGAKGVAAGVAGAAGAGYVLAQPVRRTMDYDRRLAMMANTAYAERDVAGRRAGMRELDEAIKHAVRVGGGTREGAAETLDNLIASGSMSQKTAINLLPTLQKNSTGTGADPNELGNIAVRAMQTFKIKENEIPMVLDMAIKAGQEGGFELKDMSKWLPQQMAAAKQSGMSGMAGMAKLLAVNQAAAITAGTKDEAGNNVVNLLAKINSQDTARDAAKISSTTFQEKKRGDKSKGIDLAGTLAAARAKGVDSLDAFVGLVDKVVSHDKRYQDIQGKLKVAKGDDRKALLESQADILQGSAVGTLIQDRQAMMALVGYMGNRQYVKDIEKKLPSAGGTGQANFDLIQGTASYQTERAKNEKAIAEQNAFDGLSNTIGDVSGKLADYAQKYPGLATALVGAGTAATALAAGASAAALPLMLMGGGGLGGLLGGAAGRGALGGVAARLGLGSAVGASSGLLLRGGLAGGLSIAALEAARAAGLPDVDEKKGRQDVKNGNWLAASTHLSAGDFLAALRDNLLKGNPAEAGAGKPLQRNAPSATAPIPQLDLLQSTANASTKLDLAAQKMQQATSTPMVMQLKGEFRINGSDLVAVVNQSNSKEARRN
ncbi:phage tail tape measure protein [Neisseriaceae bacterium JH1-16]|nr:phage tail tape measure protein [Neisseriaceae bacterium JH1-16]